MWLLIVLFGILADCFLSVLVGIIGSRCRIGFSWAFLISLIFTPLVGIIVVMLSDSLPGSQTRWGCVGTLVAIVGFICLTAFLFLLLAGAAVLAL